MTFLNYLHTTASEIEKALPTALSAETTSTILTPLLTNFADQCQGGKRIRGALVKLGYELAGGKTTQPILQVAVAFEIFQTAILAHDDIIDKSLTRRGKKSLYQTLGGNHYGISQTICLGDLGFFKSMELIATSDFPEPFKNKALTFFAQTVQETIQGEMLDILLPTRKEVTQKDIISLAELKTASYSITGPLSLGAILAGADDNLLKAIKHFGDHLGIAFQIQDDLLGVFADEQVLGKSNTSDIKEGKATLLIWHARDKATNEQRKRLDILYGKKKITTEEHEAIKKLFLDTGAYDATITTRNDYTDKARYALTTLTQDPNLSIILKELITFLLERKK